MRYATILAASAAATALMAVATPLAALADREDRARSYSYSSDKHDRAEARRAYAEQKWRRAYNRKHSRHYAYPWGPWGPFAFPPGL
jgi:hypothetical protein